MIEVHLKEYEIKYSPNEIVLGTRTIIVDEICKYFFIVKFITILIIDLKNILLHSIQLCIRLYDFESCKNCTSVRSLSIT